MGSSTEEVNDFEDLGRHVTSSDDAKYVTRRGRLSGQPFMGWIEGGLSVDRLTNMTPDEAVASTKNVAQRKTEREGTVRSVYGWAVVKAHYARGRGRKVVSTPVCGNPHHADIRMPSAEVLEKEAQRKHAMDLAAKASWRPLSEPTKGVLKTDD